MSIELLQQLIAIPSVNPMGLTRNGSEFLEGRLSQFLLQWFQSQRLQTEYREVTPGRGNVLARRDGATHAPTIVLDAHQDTVPIDGMTIPAFEPAMREGRIFGRGACDVKGGLAAVASAAAAVDSPSSWNIVVACTCDEEFGQSGVQHLIASWSGDWDRYSLLPEPPALVIVAEPTDLNVVIAHKGTIRWKLSTVGLAAHSSNPDQGRNAIYLMSALLVQLQDYAESLSARVPEDPFCGTATMSVGVIEGGQSVNIIPDHCSVQIDRRLVPGETPDAAERDLVAWLQQRSTVEFTLERIGCTAAPLQSSTRGLEAARRLQELAQRHGKSIDSIGVPFCTHASAWAAAGVPAIVFGPGSIRQAHAADEWLSTKELLLAETMLADFLRCAPFA